MEIGRPHAEPHSKFGQNFNRVVFHWTFAEISPEKYFNPNFFFKSSRTLTIGRVFCNANARAVGRIWARRQGHANDADEPRDIECWHPSRWILLPKLPHESKSNDLSDSGNLCRLLNFDARTHEKLLSIWSGVDQVVTSSILGVSSMSALCNSQEQSLQFLCLVSRRGITWVYWRFWSWIWPTPFWLPVLGHVTLGYRWYYQKYRHPISTSHFSWLLPCQVNAGKAADEWSPDAHTFSYC